MNRYISYGDYVFITFPQKKSDCNQYLYGKSILDPHVTAVSAKDLLKKGFRNCLFQIFPRNSQFLADNLNESSKNIECFQGAWKNVLEEGIKRHIGSPVSYGDSVHLLHLQTRSFLASEIPNKHENSTHQQCPRLYLTQDISQEKTCFQFETVSNYYYPGEKISFNSSILLKHVHTSNYITYLTEERKNSFKSTYSDSSITQAPVMELTMNQLPITMVEIAPYSDPQKSKKLEDSNFVLNGDFVRIYDLRLIRENLQVHKFYLEPRDPFMAEEEDSLILNYYNNSMAGFSTTNSLTTFCASSTSALNVFQIIVPDELGKEEAPIKLFPKGSSLENNKFKNIKRPYLLKHVVSSSYVMNPSASDLSTQLKIDLRSRDHVESLDKYRVSLFRLSGKESSLVVNANFLVGDYSTHKEDLVFIAQSVEEDPERIVKTIAFGEKSIAPELNAMYYKDERVLAGNYNTFLLKWDRESNLTESLRCEKVDEDELYDLNFFQASYDQLTNLNGDLESYRKSVQKDHVDCFIHIIRTVDRIKDVTVKILLFVSDKKLDGEYVHNENFFPSTMKQNYLKEFKIIEILNGIILKLSLVAAHYQELPITNDKKFEELMINFTYLLKLYMINNPANTNDLMRSVKIYLRSELMQRLTDIVTEVLNHSEYASLNLIMEILKLFIYDKTSNNYTKYSPHSDLSVKILKILIAVSKFKSFCIALQRYRNFWSSQFIMSVFPKLVLNTSTKVLEVHYKDTHLINLIDIVSQKNPTIEADYVLSSLSLITILAKKLPNFQRLYTALKDFVPYELCLEVIQYSERETYSFALKKLILDLVVHFHFKFFQSQILFWPYQFIKASNVNLPTFPDIEVVDQMLQSTNSLPQKLTLINIFNLYNKKLQLLLNDKLTYEKGVLTEILNILQFSSIFFKNNIIEFQVKKPFLILYQGYSNLHRKLEEPLIQGKRLSEEEDSLVKDIRNQFKEIQISINQAIETFFAREYLQFLRYKYNFTDDQAQKTALQHLQASLNNSRVLDHSKTEVSSNNEVSNPSDLQSQTTLRRTPSKPFTGRRPSISIYINSSQKSDDFIEVVLDNYKFEEDLKDFLVAWDKSLEPYTLGLKQIVEDQLSYIDSGKMSFGDIMSLEKLSSRFINLGQQLRNFVILENSNEIMDITKMFHGVKGVSEMIESFARDNSINTQLFDSAEADLQKILNQIGIDTALIQLAKLNNDNILKFLIENQSLFDTNYQLCAIGRNETPRQKYQDAMRILKIYDKLLDILDYFIASTNEYYMPRTLKCRLYVVQILLFFILNHPINCKALHKLLVTAYFYDIYSGRTYSPDVVLYMQVLLASLYKYSPDLLQNVNEVKRLSQIFYEPYLRNIVDLNEKFPGNFTPPFKSPRSSSPQPSSEKVNTLSTPPVKPGGSPKSNTTSSTKVFVTKIDSSNVLKVPQIAQVSSEKVNPNKYQTALIMCSFTLNSIQAFFKTSSKPLLAKYQGKLQDIFFLNSEMFSQCISDTNKYKFDDEEVEMIWLRFYQNLLKSCSEFALSSHPMQAYLLSSFGSMTNLNDCILKLKKHYPYTLKAQLIHLGTLLFSNFEANEENNNAKLEFLFILINEIFLYLIFQLSNTQSNLDLQSKEIFIKAKTLKIWQEIKKQYGVNLLEKLEAITNNPDALDELEKVQDHIQQNVFGNIIKFFKYLFKYNPPFCLTKLETIKTQDKVVVMDILMGTLNEVLEVSKLYGQQEKVNHIRNNLLIEIRNNKDYGKFHYQMKIVDFLLAFETPALLNNADEITSTISQVSVSTAFDHTIEKFLNEENIKNLERDSFMLLVKGIEEHPMSERIVKQTLNLIEDGQYSDLSKESYSFFCLLMRDLLKNKILTLQEKITEFEYRIPHIKLVQNIFCQYGFTEFIFKNMVECTEDCMLIFMEMANLLLYGGYHKVQKLFFKCFMSDHENTLMLKLNAQLKKIYERYIRKEKIRNTANQMLLIKKKLKNDHLKHKDDPDAQILSNILRFIHLLCENHNAEFQQFFKEQNHEKKLNSISINFPIELCHFINSFVDVCNYYSYSIGHQLFCALIEIIQGNCRDIIHEICNRTSIINDILILLTKYQPGTDLYKGRRFEGNHVIENLKSDAINLLLSIVESSDRATKNIIAEGIDYMLLIKATLNFINGFFKKAKIEVGQSIDGLLKIKDEEFVAQGGLSDGLNLLIVIKVLQSSSNLFKTEIMNRIQDCDEASRTMFQFYMKELGGQFIQGIEILDPNKELRKIYFSKLPSCFYLNQKIKDEIIERIDRTAYHVKISEFLGDLDEIHYKMKAQMDSALNQEMMKITQMYPKLKLYSYSLAYIINILMTLYFENEDLDIIYADSYLRWNSYFYVFLNFIQLIFSLSILVVWFGTNEPKFYLMGKWNAFARLNRKKSEPITYEEEQRWHLKPESITIQDYIRILNLNGPNAKELKGSDIFGLNIPEVQYEYVKHTLRFLFTSGTFINNLLYVVNCWLSLVVHPIFCSMQLLNTLMESKIMQSVISSFYKNAKELGITMGGSAIIVFIYSLVGFFFLRESFVIENYENVCTTIWHCFISLLNFGMRSGGGIGDVLTHEKFIDGNVRIFTGRWFYDISFYFLIIVVMLNLIFGIVIDTFSNIREEKIENQKDQTGKCFICDIDRGMLERVGSGFEEHTKHEHHMWNYIFYLVHVKTKGTTNLSEVEDYIFNSLKNKDYSWIPYKKALSMRGRGGADELERDVDEIKEKVQKMEVKLDKVLTDLADKKKKEEVINKEPNFLK